VKGLVSLLFLLSFIVKATQASNSEQLVVEEGGEVVVVVVVEVVDNDNLCLSSRKTFNAPSPIPLFGLLITLKKETSSLELMINDR
jgi:hypothetical protein